MPTLGLAMIVRDAEQTLPACLDSVKPFVDQIVIVLAGKSKDKTAEIARRYTSEVYDFEWVDNFALARNASFERLTTDWAMWLDADDILMGGENLKHLLEEAERQGFGSYHLPYEYRHNEQGKVTVVHNRERLLRRDLGWTWKPAWRVHEFAVAGKDHLVATSDDVWVKHTTDKANAERNWRLLEMMAKEMPSSDPDYPRFLGCMQDICASTGRWNEAIEWGEKHFEATAQHTDVQWTAATELSRAYQKQQDWPMSVHWAHVAASINPQYALPYLLLAHAAWFGSQDSARALLYLQDADVRDEAPLTVFRQPLDYTVNRWNIEHRCYADQGRWQEALDTVIKAEHEMGLLAKDRPKGWGGWDYWSWYYLERVNCERSVAGASALVDHLFRRGDTLRAKKLLEECLPLSVRSDARLLKLHDRVRSLTAHVMGSEADYTRFYEENHYDAEHAENCLNGTNYEPYRMNVILKRLKAMGAKTVLDVGCGAGGPDFFLAENGIKVVGIDINSHAVKEARKLARRHYSKKSAKYLLRPEFHLGTVETLGPEDLGKFDAVLMLEVIEHLPPNKVPFYFSSCEDFLNPGGSVMITCPGMSVGDIPGIWSEFPRDHVQEFSRQDLERILTNYPGNRYKQPLNLYKVYDPEVSVPGFASWFMEYSVGAEPSEAWQQPIVLYVGEGLEEWDPHTPEEKGLGGSETWAAHVAQEFRKKGHPVVVYAAVDGVYDGVIYRNAQNFNPEAPFAGAPAWMCIVSRYLPVLDQRPNAEHVLFMAHDVDYGTELTTERLANADAYLVLSEWQRKHTLDKYHEEPFAGELAEKIRLTQNGIVPEYFTGEDVGRIKHSFIWGSSPDRGLDRLLDWWPRIRELWPDATLNIFYGWENVDKLATQGRPWLMPFKQRVMQLARQDGVSWKGRVGQKALAEEYRKHQFWLYPSSLPEELGGGVWNETFCIAALEAAAGGCLGMFPSAGALTERPGKLATECEVLTLDDALTALKQADNYARGPFPIYEWTWEKAAESILAAVKEEVPA